MSDLPKFMLKPFRDDYSFGLANPTIITPTAAGPSRARDDVVSGMHVVSPTYKCTRAMYRYFLRFLRAYRSQRFLAYLLIDDIDHQWYECMITNQGPISVQAKGDQIFTVQLTLEAEPLLYDIDADKAFVKIYEMTDGQVERYYNQLAEFTNKDLPDALGAISWR